MKKQETTPGNSSGTTQREDPSPQKVEGYWRWRGLELSNAESTPSNVSWVEGHRLTNMDHQVSGGVGWGNRK